MSSIDGNGMLVDSRIIARRFASIEQAPLTSVSAIVVHQTDTTTAQQVFNSYTSALEGAHFLIDEVGQIFQTASLRSGCYHIGRRIKSKCLAIDKTTCDSAAMAKIMAMHWGAQIEALNKHERSKNYPDRYPVNSDSIGIEIVGRHIDDSHYQAVTAQQNASLQWLVNELYGHFNLKGGDVYRHSDVSYKNPDEAGSATWQ
jgi:N-acetyl-anhydromuramyl-L-alanine amidase AmpD